MSGSDPRPRARVLALALLLLAGGCGRAGPEAQAPAAEPVPSAPSSTPAAEPVPDTTVPDTAAAATAGVPEPPGQENPLFAPVLPQLRSEVRIPLRLPRVVGWEDSPPDSGFAIVERADSAGYVLMLATVSDCEGGNSCRYGRVSGERVAGAREVPEGTPVPLADGVTGHFVDATCGATCGDSKLWWVEDGIRYSVGVKAAPLETLVPIARSALGRR